MFWIIGIAYCTVGIILGRKVALWSLNKDGHEYKDAEDLGVAGMVGATIFLGWPIFLLGWAFGFTAVARKNRIREYRREFERAIQKNEALQGSNNVAAQKQQASMSMAVTSGP